MIAAGRFRSHTTHAVRQLDDRRPLRKTRAGVPVRASARAPVAALASVMVMRVLRRRPRRPARPPRRPRRARPVRQTHGKARNERETPISGQEAIADRSIQINVKRRKTHRRIEMDTKNPGKKVHARATSTGTTSYLTCVML